MAGVSTRQMLAIGRGKRNMRTKNLRIAIDESYGGRFRMINENRGFEHIDTIIGSSIKPNIFRDVWQKKEVRIVAARKIVCRPNEGGASEVEESEAIQLMEQL